MTGRREFLKTAGSAGALGGEGEPSLPSRAVLRQAREIVRRGELGRIGLCRLEHRGLMSPASYILDQEPPHFVIEVEPAAKGMAFLGSRATLVVTRDGCRVFERES